MERSEHFIAFSDAMVRAILDGRKTQTRRLIRAPRGYRVGCYTEGSEVVDVIAVDEDGDPADVEIRCPYGVPGDRLLVREGVAHAGGDVSVYTADGSPTRADCWPWKVKRLAPRFCPRGLVRITLEVTSVRVERLQSISEDDAKAEGLCGPLIDPELDKLVNQIGRTPREAFAQLWDVINGKRAPSASNPLVWVVGFRRLEVRQ